jgi:hypothetical protein
MIDGEDSDNYLVFSPALRLSSSSSVFLGAPAGSSYVPKSGFVMRQPPKFPRVHLAGAYPQFSLKVVAERQRGAFVSRRY